MFQRVKEKLPKRKSVVLILAVAALAFLVGYFIRSGHEHGRTKEKAQTETVEDKDASQKTSEKEEIWTCPMHPQIRMPEPGECPICGMELVPADETEGGDSDAPVLRMSPAARQLAQIQTSAVQRRYVTKNIRMVGKIQYDEQRVTTISSRVPGRLDKLYVDFTGTTVYKGDHMVYLYSPKIRTAEKELLQAIQTVEDLKDSSSESMLKSAHATVESAREKLRLWGLSKAQIRKIEKQDKPSDHITINAPRNGVVIEKNAKEGAYVDEGTDIYKVADLSQVWVMLDAYESDLQWLKYGQPVEFEVEAYPGRTFKGRISFIEPFMTEKTRTIKVRLNASNPKRILKPGMFVHAKVKAKMANEGLVMDADIEDKWVCPMHPGVIKDTPGTCDICGMELVTPESRGYISPDQKGRKPLVIPETAPLITGKRAVVYVKVPDTDKPVFEGRVIELGPHAGDFYIVESGLKEGERVVSKGNFKIDSALQIQAKRSMMSITEDEASAEQEEEQFEDIPPAFRNQLMALLEASFNMQNALVQDNKNNALKAAETFSQKLKAVDMTLLEGGAHNTWMNLRKKFDQPIQQLRGAEKMQTVRREFRKLSEALVKIVRRFGVPEGEAVYRFWCPMAFDSRGASWLGPEEKVQNPYMGTSMPSCGSVEETFGKEK